MLRGSQERYVTRKRRGLPYRRKIPLGCLSSLHRRQPTTGVHPLNKELPSISDVLSPLPDTWNTSVNKTGNAGSAVLTFGW